MPGHIIELSCDCGFEKDALVGARRDGGGTDLAYSEAGDDLDAFDSDEIERKGLRQIEDPFLSKWPGPDATPEQREEYFRPKTGPYGGYECPKCKCNSLALTLRGHWD